MDAVARRRRAGARHRILHDHPPRPGRRLHRRALQHRIPGRARARRDAPARGGGAHHAADAQGFPRGARGRVSLERLLRQRREMDGAGRHRSSRPSARTRSTRTSGSTTRRRSRPSSPSRTSRVAQAAASSPASLQAIEDNLPIDRSTATPSSARWRRSPSSTRCSRPATAIAASRPRRSTCPTTSGSIREKGSKRVMLKNNQEAKFEQGAGADRAGGARGRRPGATSRSTRSSPTS